MCTCPGCAANSAKPPPPPGTCGRCTGSACAWSIPRAPLMNNQTRPDTPARSAPRLPRARRRPRIRRRLALISAVATSTVMLAFCIPLSFVVRSLAYDRAIDTAELQARTLAAELATAHDTADVVKLARQANSAAANTASVYLASGHTVGGLSHVAAPLPPGVLSERTATTIAAGGS